MVVILMTARVSFNRVSIAFQSRFNRVSIAFDCCLTTGKFRFVLLQIGFSADAVTALKLVEKVHLCSVISNDRDSSSTINCYQDNGDDDEWRWAMAALISNRFSLHFEGRSESATGAPAGASGPAPNRPAADDKSLHDRTAAHGSLPQSHPLQVNVRSGVRRAGVDHAQLPRRRRQIPLLLLSARPGYLCHASDHSLQHVRGHNG